MSRPQRRADFGLSPDDLWRAYLYFRITVIAVCVRMWSDLAVSAKVDALPSYLTEARFRAQVPGIMCSSANFGALSILSRGHVVLNKEFPIGQG